jgi:hypothetical protein
MNYGEGTQYNAVNANSLGANQLGSDEADLAAGPLYEAGGSDPYYTSSSGGANQSSYATGSGYGGGDVSSKKLNFD